MALIEVFHVVASEMLVDPLDTTGVGDIPQGALVTLNPTDGLVTMNVAVSGGPYAIGLAGDSRSHGTTSYTPESGYARPGGIGGDANKGALVVGSTLLASMKNDPTLASRRFTQNRVADNYNEVLSSGKMTVYHSGGEFWTDAYYPDVTYLPGALLYMSNNANYLGHFTTQPNTDGLVCGQVLTAPTSYPSGVPGTETHFTELPEGGNSLSYGMFLHIKLKI